MLKPETKQKEITKIVAFGDSITYGYGAKPDHSYPSILQKLSGIDVVNAGRNGETTAEGLKRLPVILKRHKPDLLILCEGGNDFLQGVDEVQIKENLRTMIQEAKGEGVEVVLIAVPRLTLFGLDDAPLYEELAEEENVLLIDDLLEEILSTPSLKSDRIHPNEKGYERLAKEVMNTLDSL